MARELSVTWAGFIYIDSLIGIVRSGWMKKDKNQSFKRRKINMNYYESLLCLNLAVLILLPLN